MKKTSQKNGVAMLGRNETKIVESKITDKRWKKKDRRRLNNYPGRIHNYHNNIRELTGHQRKYRTICSINVHTRGLKGTSSFHSSFQGNKRKIYPTGTGYGGNP